MTFGRTARLLGRLLLGLIAIALLLPLGAVAALWWANRHDDALRPEVAAAMAFNPPSAEAMRRNGYFTMMGLAAPPDQDAHAAGERFFAVQLAGYKQFRQTGDDKAATPPPFAPTAVPAAPLRCDAEVRDCYAHYVDKAATARQRLAEQAVLLQRYLSLRTLPVYEEVVPPYTGVQFAYYQHLVAASELVGVRAALAWHAGRRDEALALLAANAQLHQRLRGGARTLLGGMIVVAMDLRQQRLVAGMARALTPGDRSAPWAALQALLITPPPAPDMLLGERQLALGTFDMLLLQTWLDSVVQQPAARWGANRLTRMAYLPHATLNASYDDWQQAMALASAPADQFSARADALRRDWADRLQGEGKLPVRLRNASGHVLLGMTGAFTMQPFLERIHDAEGHRRLVRLLIAAHRDAVPAADMPAWLARQPDALHDPYLKRPMAWEADTQTLVFTGRQKNPQNEAPQSEYRVRWAAAGG